MLCALMIIPLKSQDESPLPVLPPSPKLIGRVSLVSPKLLLEIPASEKFTVTTGLSIRPSLIGTNTAGENEFKPTISPSILAEPRYYFNLEDRKLKGKRTEYYSGWYIGMPLNLDFPDLQFVFGGNIGFQCIIGNRWYWNISTGPGFAVSGSDLTVTGVGDFGLGIILN